MRFDVGRNGRITATATFYGLVLLAFGLLAGLSGFVSYFAPLYQTCKSLWDNLLLWLSSLSALVPLTVGASLVLMAGVTLIRQWRATQRLLSALAPHQVAVPPRLARIAGEVGLEDRLDCVSDVMIGPFCYGFIRPRVCVPTALLEMLDDAELRAVLRHESCHARSHDPLKIWLSRGLARGLYFLPLAGDLRDSYLTAKEVAADELMTQTDELPLASALVKMMAAGASRLQPATPVLSSVEAAAGALGDASIAGLISVTHVSSNETEERIRRLIDGEPAPLRLPSLTNVVLSVMIVVAIFAASYTNLSATSVMPVSQECVTENLLRHPEPASTNEWHPVATELVGTGPVMQGEAAPSTVLDEFGCDLLRPSCTESVSGER